jgi:hypothetical protein
MLVPSEAGGPKTEEGKEVVRWNATRHGIRSPAPVVPGVEKRENWEEHRDGVLESLSPEGHLELVLAERVALLSWRLNRVTRYETESIALFQEKVEEDLAERRRRPFSNVLGPAHPQEVRNKVKEAKSTERLLKKFPDLPDDKALSGDEAAAILYAVDEQTGEDAGLEVSFPALPEDLELFEEFEGWTAGLVRGCMVAVASRAEEDPQKLLMSAVEDARRGVIRAKKAAGEMERDLKRMSRERLLPDEKTLEKVARYEAHLSRGLYKAMHELEALQARRTGGAAPLARLDVDGLTGSWGGTFTRLPEEIV